VTDADFSAIDGGTGLVKQQLYSTASYEAKNLGGIKLVNNDLAGWDFNGQNLTRSILSLATLTNANLTRANLANAMLNNATLTDANLTGAVVAGSDFSLYSDSVTLSGLAKEQLYSTASYQTKNLRGIGLSLNNLTGWEFTEQNLTNANLTRADARGATGLNVVGATTTNLIRPDGRIAGLNLAAGEKLVAYPGVSIPIQVSGGFSIAPDAIFDLTDNAAIIDYIWNSPATTVRAQIRSGRGRSGLGGAWNGTGITSSTAATTNQTARDSRSLGYVDNATLPLGPYTSFHGAAVGGASILIAFTRTGDANLDGVVNEDDVTIVGAMYAPGVPQPSWALGDFDYNGFVNDDDVTLLNAFYDPSAAPLNSPASPTVGGVLQSGVSAVPEPSTIVLAVVALVGLLVWRRKATQIIQ
jgi:uncharacterized protein YjbI with pentapeptide repeats